MSIMVRQGPTELAVGAGVELSEHFSLISYFSLSLSPSVWKMARYRLKLCLKMPLNDTAG